MNKGNILLILASVLFVGVLIVVTTGSKDSQENQLTRRLKAFESSVPDNVKNPFLNKDYDTAKLNLTKFISEYQSYTNSLKGDDKVRFLKAEFATLSNKSVLKTIPPELLKQWTKYFSVIDYECIIEFTPSEVVDFFKENFVDKLETTKV